MIGCQRDLDKSRSALVFIIELKESEGGVKKGLCF